MSIKPLDLQTMFAQLNEVSRKQAINQQSGALQQSQEAKKLLDQAQREKERVNPNQEDQDARSVKEKEHSSEKEGEQTPKKNQNPKGKDKPEVLQDPEMGNHVDLSG